MSKHSLLLLGLCIMVAVVIFLWSHGPNVAIFGGTSAGDNSSPDSPKPASDYNIVLITVDTLRADHLGCYGYQKGTSPNIDRFAEESILFEKAYSPAPVTVPALRAMMTGRLVSNEDKEDLVSYYNQTPFLAQILREKGYRTAGFTDHHGLGGSDRKGELGASHTHSLHKGFDTFENLGKSRKEITSDELSERALEWMGQNHGARFFLWIHYFDPHYNFRASSEHEGLFGFSTVSSGRIYNGIDIMDIRKIVHSLSPSEIKSIIALYDSEIFFTDKHIGKVLDRVKVLGLDRSTVIVVAADHGEEFKERTRIGHERTIYNELIHVPLIVKIPGEKPRRIRSTVTTTRIFDFLSGPGAPSIESLKNGGPAVSRTFHYYKDDRVEPNDFAIISGSYKYVLNPGTRKEELYNVSNDDLEMFNPDFPYSTGAFETDLIV